MTERELSVIKQAFIDIDNYEVRRLKAFPTVNIIDIDGFDKRMLAVTNNESHREGFSSKKIIITIIAAALLLSAAISAYAFREPIKAFFMKNRDTHSLYEYPTEKPSPITSGIFQPTWLPEGYSQSDYSESKTFVQTTWVNGTSVIVLKQKMLSGGGSVDTENSDYEVVTVNGQNYYCISKNGIHDIIWRNDLYAFTLWCYGTEREDALKIATSLKVEKEFPKE